MSVKDRIGLTSSTNTNLPDNNTRKISPLKMRQVLYDLIDSAINRKGDTNIEGVLKYSSTHSITEDNDIIYKKYADDILSALDALVLYKDGSRAMTGNLNGGGNLISNFSDIVLLDGGSVGVSLGYFTFAADGKVTANTPEFIAANITGVNSLVLNNGGAITNGPVNAGFALLDIGAFSVFGTNDSTINTNAGSLSMLSNTAVHMIGPNGNIETIASKNSSVHDTLIEQIAPTINITGDVVTIGKAGAVVNIIGGEINYEATQSYIDDKRITLNRGGSAASGVNSGIEVEENAIVTGWFYTNSTRDGWELKAPGISSKATLSLASLTADRVYTLPDKAITFAGVDNETFTGTTNFSNIIVASDTDIDTVLGRVKIGGSPYTDNATFAHIDNFNSNNYAFRQSASGVTIFNGVGSVGFRLSNATVFSYTSATVNISIPTASTSKTTGSLIVGGGVGISGNLYAGNTYIPNLNILDFDGVTYKTALDSSATNVLRIGVGFSQTNFVTTTGSLNFYTSGVLRFSIASTGVGTYYNSLYPSASDTYSLGNNTSIWTTVYTRVIQGVTKSGVDSSAPNLTVRTSIGTGASTPSQFVVQTPGIEASGSTVQSLANRLSVDYLKADFSVPVQIPSTEAYYLGDKDTDSSWRVTRSGNNLVFERRESGSWVTKNTIVA